MFVTQASAYPQMGVLYLADALKQSGYESSIVPSDIDIKEFNRAIQKLKPAIVGMSVLTAPQVADFEKLSLWVKSKYPNIKIKNSLIFFFL